MGHRWVEEKMGMMTKEGLLGIKSADSREEQRKLIFCHMKLLEDGLMQDGIKCVRHLHLQHHSNCHYND
jgi:hypothetical protein